MTTHEAAMRQALEALEAVRRNMLDNAPHLSGKSWGMTDKAIEAHSKLNDETTLDFIRQQSRIDELQHKLNAAEARERHTRSTLNKLLARPAEHLKLLQDTQRTSDAFCARKIAQQGEPVAWYDEEMDCAYTASELDGGTSEWLTPLYAAAAPQQVVKTTPEWWPAVENILTEYGLDAISFVADFKKASTNYPAQIKQDISAPQAQPECTRSHPHELMDGYCELRTEIARLTNENARLKTPWLLKTTQDLAIGIAKRCYPEVTQFEVLDDLAGVISQIDNMTTGMGRKQAQQPLTGDM